jgi:hypothetical protein
VPGVAKRSLHRAPHRGIVLDQEDVHRVEFRKTGLRTG